MGGWAEEIVHISKSSTFSRSKLNSAVHVCACVRWLCKVKNTKAKVRCMLHVYAIFVYMFHIDIYIINSWNPWHFSIITLSIYTKANTLYNILHTIDYNTRESIHVSTWWWWVGGVCLIFVPLLMSQHGMTVCSAFNGNKSAHVRKIVECVFYQNWP